MDFINVILAKLFDSFKAKNPMIATAVIALLSGAVIYLEAYGQQLLGDSATVVLQVIGVVLIGLQGSRTTDIIAEDKKANK